MKIERDAYGMSFRPPKAHAVRTRAGREFSFPFCAVRMKVMIFETESHLLVQLETQPGEGLISKHRVRIRPVHRRAADPDPLRIDDRKGTTRSASNIRPNPVTAWTRKAGVDEQRHIRKYRVHSRRIRDRINRVRYHSGFDFRRKPISEPIA